jgi:hypothetical protein
MMKKSEKMGNENKSIKHLVSDKIRQARDEENPGAVQLLDEIMEALCHLRDDRIAGYDDRIFIIRRCNQRIKYQRKELRRFNAQRVGGNV